MWDLDALMLAPSLMELLAPWSGVSVDGGNARGAASGGGGAAASGSAAAAEAPIVDMFDSDDEEGEEGSETGVGGARRAAVRLRRAEHALLRSCFFYDAIAPYDSHMCAVDAQQYDDNQPLERAALVGDAFSEAAAAAVLSAAAKGELGGAVAARGGAAGGATAAFARRQAAMLRRMMLPPAALRGLSYRYRLATTAYREWRDRLSSRDEHAMGSMPLPMTRQDSLDAVMPLPLGPEEVRAQSVLEGFLKRACGLALRADVDAALAASTKAGFTNVLVSETLPLLRVLAAVLVSGCSQHFGSERVYSAATDPLGSCLLRIRAQFGPQCKLAFVTPGVEAAPRRCVL